jgi:TonB-dependent SusC/RagA subfamily outer membrane receptor
MKFYAITMAVPRHDKRPVLRKILLVMKLTTLLLIIGLLQVSARSFSQITLKETNAPLATVLKKVEKQTGYFFIYNDQQIQLGTVTVALKNANIDQALQALFSDKAITYKIIDKNIVLLPNKPEEPTIFDKIKSAVNLPSDITGTVADTTGTVLIGASVSLKGTNFRTLTDNKGNFTFTKLPQGKYTLVITYIGFEKLEKTIESEGKVINLKIVLHSSSSALDAVQVIAYGTTTQRLTTSDITSVSAKDIEEQPVSNILAALEGRVPGLVVTQINGVPGSSYNVQLNGQSSIGTQPGTLPSDNPLFIIDGVPYGPNNNVVSNVPSALGLSGISPMVGLNPSDVESIEVLKDADATAIYGSRGANGVILITTKRAKTGKTIVSANFNTGISHIPDVTSVLTN